MHARGQNSNVAFGLHDFEANEYHRMPHLALSIMLVNDDLTGDANTTDEISAYQLLLTLKIEKIIVKLPLVGLSPRAVHTLT